MWKKSRDKIVEAIKHHGGEASTVQIHAYMAERSLFGFFVPFPWTTLDEMEREGLLTSKREVVTAERRIRLYSVV